MKNILTSLLILASFYSFGQVEYIELPGGNREVYKILTIYEDGLILAATEYPRNLYISQDNGETWTELEFSEIENISSSNLNRFEMNKLNQYLFSSGGDIYRIDLSSFEINLHLSISNLRDFDFLPNDNLVVASKESLNIYDENLILLNTHEWDASYLANLLIGENGNNLVAFRSYSDTGFVHEILEFEDDLTNVAAAIPFYEHSNQIYYSNSRIYITSGYSDDGGVTLEDYDIPENVQIRSLSALKNRVALVSYDDVIYMSIDSGDTFEELELDPLINRNSFNLFLDDGIYYTLSNEDGSYLRLSENNGDSYTDYDLNLGLEYTLSAVADDTGYIIASNYDNKQAFDPISSNWKILRADSCSFTNDLIVQPNGSFICGECITYDGGKNWEYLTQLGSHFLHQKNDVLYDITTISTGSPDFLILPRKQSTDYGLSWQSTFPYGFAVSYCESGVTANGDVIAEFVTCFSCFNEVRYHFMDGGFEIVDLPKAFIEYDVFTAYSSSEVYYELSKNLYVCSNGYSNPIEITKPPSIDGNFNIYTDILNNVYIYSSNKVFVSSNLGSTWEDITPVHDDILSINSITLGRDLHYYISTFGTSVLKSVEPLGRLKEVEVLLFEDSNMNCEYDQNEVLLEGFEVKLNGRIRKVTNTTSPIKFYTHSAENTISIAINEDIYAVCDFDESVVYTADIDSAIRYIPVTISKECSELQINGTTPLLRRCFENSYSFEVKNTGSVTAEDVEVDILLDDYFDFISSDAYIVNQSGQELKVRLENIPPNSSRRFRVKFLLSCDAELGEAHYMNASVEMQNPCYEQNVSMSFECRENIGSFDPNDKQAFVDGVSNIDVLSDGETLEYLVRFQNTGTDTAFTVRVEDRLVSAFDPSTLEIVSASHDYRYEIDRRNLIVTFDNILLPDSTTNEEASNGFIKFKVDIIEEYKKGDVFNNKADIFFDFNDPVRTNTTSNYYWCKHKTTSLFDTICPGESSYGYTEQGNYSQKLETHLGCDSLWKLNLIVREELAPECQPSAAINIDTDLDIIVYPNPTDGKVYVSLDGYNIVTAKVLLPNGQSMGTYQIENNQFEIDGPDGVYFLELTTENGLVAKRKIVLIK